MWGLGSDVNTMFYLFTVLRASAVSKVGPSINYGHVTGFSCDCEMEMTESVYRQVRMGSWEFRIFAASEPNLAVLLDFCV